MSTLSTPVEAELNIPSDVVKKVYTVPDNVSMANFLLVGGAGGEVSDRSVRPGMGAAVRLWLPVKPGEILTAYLGGQASAHWAGHGFTEGGRGGDQPQPKGES
ncbi:hypothetical protein KDL01_40730, partial [Actinospica durhamensis]